jgi:hypothetical protein
MRRLVLLVLLATSARASSVTDELTVNSSQPTDTNPRSGSVGDALRANLDLADPLTLELGATLTSQSNSPSLLPNQTGDSSVALLSAGLDWMVTDSWTLAVHGEWSPQTTQFADAPVQLLAGTGTAHIRSVSSEVAAGADVAYDTSGESDLEWSLSAGVNLAHWDIDQSVPRVTNAAGTVVTQAQARSEVNTFCASHPALKNCGKRVLRELTAGPFALDSLEFSAGATAVVKRDTDLTLSADYYSYLGDATQTGYASLIFNGRGGAGVPVAPLRYLIRPEVAHRFGGFSATLWAQAGEYVMGAGGSTGGVGLKLQYKFSRTFRMWVRALAQRDVDDQGNETRSGSLGLGAGYRF